MFQAGAAIDAELIAATCEHVDSDPKMRLLIIYLSPDSNLISVTNSLNQLRGEPPTLNTRNTVSTDEILLLANLQAERSPERHANELPTTCSHDLLLRSCRSCHALRMRAPFRGSRPATTQHSPQDRGPSCSSKGQCLRHWQRM